MFIYCAVSDNTIYVNTVNLLRLVVVMYGSAGCVFLYFDCIIYTRKYM